ncbi:MAG TPA: response regulator transcription factor [Chitinophagaceae bacterium]|nr:response regulator transcription factor [Chitinophagaceae bacterium]
MKSKMIKVAFAEDHTSVREGIVAVMNNDPAINVMIEAENGRVLLDKILRSDTLPDVCLIDLNMPVMNGFELLKEIKSRWPGMPCIVLSAIIEENYIISLLRLGANSFLNKSCATSEIILAVKQVHEYGHFYNDILNERIIENVVNVKQKMPVLTEREIQLLKYVCTELNYAEIAAAMNTTFKTVDGIRERLCLKLRINTRVGLALAAIRLGYVTLETEHYLH